MDKSDILVFLETKQWDQTAQKTIVDLWNDLRGDALGKITTSAVRTPCRLRQVRNSLRKFVQNEM